MFSCPCCGRGELGDRVSCPGCGADLELLGCLDRLPDAYFNRGLEALDEGRTGRALEWLAASCATRPSDAAAHIALARVWARLGHAAEARDALERARAIDAAAGDFEAIGEAIDELESQSTAPNLRAVSDAADVGESPKSNSSPEL